MTNIINNIDFDQRLNDARDEVHQTIDFRTLLWNHHIILSRPHFRGKTGVTIFGSHQTTQAIYDEANRNFGAPAAQNL